MRWILFLPSAVACFLAAVLIAAPEDPLGEELERLRRLAAGVELEQDRQARIEGLLSRIELEAASGRRYSALQELYSAYVFLEVEAYRKSRSAIPEAGREALVTESRKVEAELVRREGEIEAAGTGSLPAAVRALAEAAQRKARPYHHAALIFADATDLGSGVYYLGRSRAYLGFALLCRRLGFAETAPAPEIPALAVAIARLEVETNEAYRRPGAAVEQHSQFISLNSTIKEARELEADGLRFGTLSRLLEARLRLQLIRADGSEVPSAADLRQRAEPWRERLGGDAVDHSLGRLFWEPALATLDAEEPGDDEIRRAAAVLEHVLPRYFEILREPAP